MDVTNYCCCFTEAAKTGGAASNEGAATIGGVLLPINELSQSTPARHEVAATPAANRIWHIRSQIRLDQHQEVTK